MKVIDYHIHSLYSADSNSPIEQIARIAFNKGISEIALTDHFEPSILDDEYKDYDPRGQKIDIEICRELYENRLVIRHGVELGQPHYFKEVTKKLLEKVEFDYVIGSAHKNEKSIDVKNGKGIEVNTSGVRHTVKSFLPEFDIIKFYKQLGGKIITVGSDAHSAIHVGSDISLAYEMIKAAGFNEITTYQKRTPSFVRIGERKVYSMAAI